jgi:NAD(P)-dependent dehydrogenase (short-subunit alcohol dehydrogenase family)
MRYSGTLLLSLCVSINGFGLLPPSPLCRKRCCIKKKKRVFGGGVALLPPPPLSPLVALKKSKLIRKKRKNCLKKKVARAAGVAFVAGIGGAVAVGGAAVVGAPLILDQINSNRVIYEPDSGSLIDTVVLITGATSGLGLESAKRLAAAGATVVLTSRSVSKGEKAIADVKTYLMDKGMTDADMPKLYSLVLDLDDLDQVKQFPESFKELGLGSISVLLNNAGVMAIPQRELTKDGFERTFQSNHLGHFALTAGLFPFLSRDGAKVINVSSSAANIPALTGLDTENLNGERSYSAWSSYGLSKLANILFTNELQKRADAAGLDWLTTVSLHPGAVNTDLWRYIVGEDKLQEIKENDSSFSIESFALTASSAFTKTPEQGANTQVFLAAGADGKLVKGAFYDEMKVKELPVFMKDEDKAKTLWELSEEYTGVTFELNALDSEVDVAVVEEAIEEAVISVLEDKVGDASETPDEDESVEESESEVLEEDDDEEEDIGDDEDVTEEAQNEEDDESS